jgi:hypothetical protein
MSLTLEWSQLSIYTWVGSDFVKKYQTWLKVYYFYKHSSLLLTGDKAFKS